MKVMTLHDFFDADIEKVLWESHDNIREVVLSSNNDGAVLISKEDIIAFAKEFNLIVFEKDSIL